MAKNRSSSKPASKSAAKRMKIQGQVIMKKGQMMMKKADMMMK